MRPAGPGRLQLGWQFATLHPPPGPPPRRPTPPEAERLSPAWATAQRREERLLNRPLRVALWLSGGGVLVAVVLGLSGVLPALAAGLLVICCALVAAISGYAIWQGERALRGRVADEQRRVGKLRAAQESRLFAWQAEHATRVHDWQASRIAYEHQKRWYAVWAPDDVHRVDLAGGTLSGWSAMLATAAAHRLAGGGEITVLDLSEGAVAHDLIGFARAAGLDPHVWVLPGDLPRLDLGAVLGPDHPAAGSAPSGEELAELLAQVVSGSEPAGSSRDTSLDAAILERVIGVLGGQTTVAGVTAALRALGQVGNPRDDVAAGLLSSDEADRVAVLFGRGAADRVVTERALILQARLRKLASVGTQPAAPQDPPAPLRVIALGQSAGPADGQVIGSYLVAALTHALRAGPGYGARSGPSWRHTVFLLGAERLPGELLDRLADACERTGTGLVLAYRTISAQVKERLGRGNAVVAFMRLGNAEEAKAASEQLGTEHRFVLSQLTETIGVSVTDTTANAYTSTAGLSDSLARSQSVTGGTSVSASHGRSGGGLLPLAGAPSRSVTGSDSVSVADSESVTASLSASTAWGLTTSRAVGGSDSAAAALQRSREFLVEQHELQQLPASAMIISYAGPGGRRVVLADVNPGIAALSSATQLTLEESTGQPGAASQAERAGPYRDPVPAPASWRSGPDRPPPNLGPPPQRLDWRKPRS